MKRHFKQFIASLLVLSTLAGCHTNDAKHLSADVSGVSMSGKGTAISDSVAPPSSANPQVVQPQSIMVGNLVGSKHVLASSPTTIATNDVKLIIDSGAVSRDVDISIVATTEEHSGEIPEHMENLTANKSVYRMLPDGQKFERDITIAMRYDSTALPYGYTANDIYTFFYNEETRMWQQVERDSVDTHNQIVYSRTNHFTDYINGVLKVPDNSDVTSYTPTSISSLEAADPMEDITLIAAPEANNQGTANLSYPLNLPSGRHGMEPSLAVSYNSGGGSSILGQGWSLPISEISVETRWGVPLYSNTLETEGYLLDGTTLVTSYRDENDNLRLNKPVYHRAYEARCSSDTLRFYPRVEGSFRKIERIGSNPKEYTWVVTDKDGVRHFYGLTNQSTLRDHNRNIAKWMLEKSVDTYGNTVNYLYTTLQVTHPGQQSGKQLCISQIRYTGKENANPIDQGQYIINFRYADKLDKSNSFRYGLEEINNQLLDRIEIMFRDTIVREYYFGYNEGAFGKTLLCKIFEGYDDSARYQQYHSDSSYNTIRNRSVYDRCNFDYNNQKSFYLHLFHAFDYYGLESDSLFSAPDSMGYADNNHELIFQFRDSTISESGNFSGSGSLGWNVGGGINAGIDFLAWLKTTTAGGHYNFNEDYGEGFIQLVDVNGDGYPDKLYKTILGTIKCRPQIPGTNSFGSPISINSINSFQHTSSSTHNWGAEASAGFLGGGVSWNDSRSNTYTYIADVNGDGMIDVVDNGSVYINRGNFRFSNVTANDTIHVGGTCDNDVIDFTGEVSPTIFDDGYYTVERVECTVVNKSICVHDTVYNADGTYTVLPTEHVIQADFDSCWTVVDTFYYTYPRRYEPMVDLVRMWIAPYTGIVHITGNAQLTSELSGLRDSTRTYDGVWASIQNAHDTTLIASRFVVPDSSRTMEAYDTINAGDTIYFRLSAVDKRLYDQVNWSPRIVYINATHINGVTNLDSNSLDANGNRTYVFDYSDDYMLSELQSVAVGPDTVGICYNNYNVKCWFHFRNPITQAMTYTVYRTPIDDTEYGGVTLASCTFPIGFSHDTLIEWNVSHIIDTQKVYLRLAPVGGGQLNWSDIETFDTVTLTASTDPAISARLADSDGRLAYVYYPAVQRTYYDFLILPGSTVSNITGSPNMTIRAYKKNNTVYKGTLYLTVKDQNNNVCYGRSVTIPSSGTITLAHPFNFTLGSNAQYHVDCYITDLSVASNIRDIQVRFGSGNYMHAGLYTKYDRDIYKHNGTMYRGWGQFGYKSDDSTSLYIKRELTVPYTMYSDYDQIPDPSESDLQSIDTSAFNSNTSPDTSIGSGYFNPLTQSWFEMHVDGRQSRWLSYGNAVAADRYVSSLDNCDAASENGQTVTVNMFQSPMPVVSPGSPIKAVNKMTMSKGFGYTILMASSNSGHSRLLGDYMDINGDRYPDVVSEKTIQYSKAQGGLSDLEKGYSMGEGINLTYNKSTGVTFNGTFLNALRESNNNLKNSRVISKVSGLAQLINTSGSISRDTTHNTLMDINGDGLPDIVYHDARVRYNMGYRFTSPQPMPATPIRISQSTSSSAGIGFNVANTSISGGFNVNVANNHTVTSLTDMNGDGFPELINASQIRINNGDGTFNNIPLPSAGMDRGYTVSISLSASGTYDAVIPVMFIPVKIGFSASAGGTASYTTSTAEFTDMNNDGYLDYVYHQNGTIKVRYANIGRANLLRSVSNFANARFEVDYTQTESTVQCPQRHWNMTSLIVFDGHSGDGVSTTYQRFHYGNRNYDRFERDDYGYDTVFTYDYESQSEYASNHIYRTTTELFYNDNYYHARLKKLEQVSQGNKYHKMTYNYADADLQDGHYLGNGTPAWCEGDGWPAVEYEDNTYSEGNGNTINTRVKYEYGPFGNVKHVEDLGDVNDNTDNYDVFITYAAPTTSYIVDNVEQLNIPGYRSRNAEYNSYGSLSKLIIDNQPSPNSAYIYEYDIYGNTSSVTTPAREYNTGNNYWIKYVYDNLIHSLPIEVVNAEGHISKAFYNYRWQKPTNTIDIANNIMHYSYDSHGHADTIIAPSEILNNQPYTIKYNYWYNKKFDVSDPYYYFNIANGMCNYTWALTQNYDPEYSGNDITTITFADGQGRIIQIKKDIEENGVERRAVNNTIHYDGLGRKAKEFFAISEALTTHDLNLNNSVATVPYNETLYDYRDRPVRMNYADGTYSTNAYSTATDASGVLRFLNTATDQNGHTSLTYTNAHELKTQTTDALNHSTTFIYDAIGQLLESIDPENHNTRHRYDFGGRRINREHPSAGTTCWKYDEAGNMIIQTQNSGEEITYDYDYTSPIHVSYSHRPWNNVWYKYGAAGTGNESGRLIAQQDATGVQKFGYDCMGNLIYNSHTYVQPHSHNTFTFTTHWDYDSWGRVKTIKYPDDEKVDYHYDRGGNVNHIEGSKAGQSNTVYIDNILYDQFGKRTYQLNGNGVETYYQYDNTTRRLDVLTNISTYTGQTLQDNHYKYDNVGNIIAIEDLGLNPRLQLFEYDNADRLIFSKGDWNGTLTYDVDYHYSHAGRMDKKNVHSQRLNTSGMYSVDYQNCYHYAMPNNPYAVTTVQDMISGTNNYFDWDANGNLSRTTNDIGTSDRRLCWTEDNRMQAYWESSDGNGNITAYYNYNADGERNFKITSPQINMQQNALTMMVNPQLIDPTLYASSLITLTKHGYTKHYYEGTNRVCSKIGGGFDHVDWNSIDYQLGPLEGENYDYLANLQFEGVRSTFNECIGFEPEIVEDNDLRRILEDHERNRNDFEPTFYYQSDHLGSAAYLTNDNGDVSQTLNYLPYGEDWVDIQNYSDTQYPRLGIYTYNAKEKDYESGFHYYGARYYWSEMLTGWLSVDPQTDDYPYITAYNYCEHNPVILQDPDGECPWAIGAVVGALADAAGQVATNMTMKGQSFGTAVKNINIKEVAISAVEGAITGGGSAVKQVVKTTAKNVVVKAASKTAAKKAAQTAVHHADLDIMYSVGKAGYNTYKGEGSLGENLAEAGASIVVGKAGSKVVNKYVKPKLTTNVTAINAAKNKNGGYISQKNASQVYSTNRANNQNAVNRNAVTKTLANGTVKIATSAAAGAGKGAYIKHNN